LIVDNYATHKHPRVLHWLVAHPRFQVHYTPTYASWLNQVEIWFHIITQQAIRGGTFGSVKDLVAKIEHFVRYKLGLSPGWPRRTQSFKRSSDFVNIFLGRDTRWT